MTDPPSPEPQPTTIDRLLREQELIRGRLSRVLHDDVIQSLVALGLRAERLAERQQDQTDSDTLRQTAQAVYATIERLRALQLELEPPDMDDGGLVGAVLRYLHMDPDDTVSWNVENLLRDEPPDPIRRTAHRIAQEAISNVRRHARSHTAGIRVEDSDGGLLLTVRDDGVGFDPTDLDPIPLGHIGLASMRERAEAVGGLCEVDSFPGRGTSVRCWLPMGAAG
jgi:signal transduction histidine kinase